MPPFHSLRTPARVFISITRLPAPHSVVCWSAVPRVARVLLVIPCTGATTCAPPSPPPVVRVESRYTHAMFVHALENNSTAPDFALFTVIDDRGKTERLGCTDARFLMGALHMEFALPSDKDGQQRAHALAYNQSDRVFHFSNPDALDNVKPRYSINQLNSMRAAIAGRPDSDVLDKAFIQRLFSQDSSLRDALAHALLERGVNCFRGCIGGDLTPYKLSPTEKSSSPKPAVDSPEPSISPTRPIDQ